MAFSIIDNQLVIANKELSYSVSDICKNQEEPFYLYDLDGIESRFDYFAKGLKKASQDLRVHYAMKANSHPLILQKLKSLGAHVDVVSLGEVKLAMENHFLASDIIFSGVGKSVKEITECLKLGIYQINVESLPELERIAQISKKLGVVAPIGIRFNPDVNPETHPYITTGFRENKFGLDFSDAGKIDLVVSDYKDQLNLQGMSIHIGSQIKDTQSFADAIEKTINVYKTLEQNPLWNLQSLDIGGGLGINYNTIDETTDLSLIDEYCALVKAKTQNFPGTLICEPGRVLVARFGALLGRVEYIKNNNYKNFAILNTGMHHLMRPCLYSATHNIVPVIENTDGKDVLYDVVGPICESSDVLGSDRLLKELKQDDWLAILDAGAYGAVMASNYNQHEMMGEFVVSSNQVHKVN